MTGHTGSMVGMSVISGRDSGGDDRLGTISGMAEERG